MSQTHNTVNKNVKADRLGGKEEDGQFATIVMALSYIRNKFHQSTYFQKIITDRVKIRQTFPDLDDN